MSKGGMMGKVTSTTEARAWARRNGWKLPTLSRRARKLRHFIGDPSEGFDRHYVERPEPVGLRQLGDCDPGIRMYVDVLSWYGVETHQSCEGGPGHGYPEPTVDFSGSWQQVWLALSVAEMFRLPVSTVGLIHHVEHGVPQGPIGRMTFSHKAGVDYTSPWRRP